MDVINNPVVAIGAVVILSGLIERFVEYFVAPALDWINVQLTRRSRDPISKKVLRYVAVAAGLIVCIFGQINILPLIGVGLPLPALIGFVITGCLMGGDASLLHEFLHRPVPVPPEVAA